MVRYSLVLFFEGKNLLFFSSDSRLTTNLSTHAKLCYLYLFDYHSNSRWIFCPYLRFQIRFSFIYGNSSLLLLAHSPFLQILILAILNDGTILTISKDRVKPSPYPNSWNLGEIFTYAVVYGVYLAASTIVFFTLIVKTTFFHDHFNVEQFQYDVHSEKFSGWNHPMLNSIIYLQVSTISQALIFITRSHHFFFLERPSIMLIGAFLLAQLIATFLAVYATWNFASIQACGWTWAAIVWIWNLIWFFPLDILKVNSNEKNFSTHTIHEI